MNFTLCNEGLPKYYSGSTDAGVLVIHGFTGRPGEMDYLARSLHDQGYTVSVPRLPGHGTSQKDFLKCTWRDWYRRVLDAYLDLGASCSRIYIAGLSMGGLLALMLASEQPCEAVAAAAPAIVITPQYSLSMTPLMGLFVKAKLKKDYVFEHDPQQNPEVHHLESEYYRYLMPGALAQLYRLQKKTRSCLNRVTAPVLVITSEQDEVVPPAAGVYLEQRLASREFKHLVYQESPHVIVNECEKQRAAEDIIDWFARFSR